MVDARGAPLGILTRHDVLDRITLPGLPLEAPVSRVMSQPVRTLPQESTAQDAALLMGTHGIRHVPVMRGGAVAGIVSERDLFALQRVTVRHVSTTIRSARDIGGLKLAALDIRRLARSLQAGVSAGHHP